MTRPLDTAPTFEAMVCECGLTRGEHRNGPGEEHAFEPRDAWATKRADETKRRGI